MTAIAFSSEWLEQQTDSDVQKLLAIAYSLRQNSNYDPDIDYTFIPVLLAFLTARDKVARWFQKYVKEASINADAIYQSIHVNPQLAKRTTGITMPVNQSPRFSRSIRNIFERAAEFAKQTQKPNQSIQQSNIDSQTGLIGTRHLMAAFIYDPGAEHEKQLDSYGIDRRDWASNFFQFLQKAYSRDNISQWKDLHNTFVDVLPFSKQSTAEKWVMARAAVVVRATPDPQARQIGLVGAGNNYRLLGRNSGWFEIDYAGKSGFVADDFFTVMDSPPKPRRTRHWLPAFDSDGRAVADLLELNDDVRPLAMLIAAKNTKPPLSIGIFGDWGSGKSFFMGMLRQHIAEYALQSKQNETSYRAMFHPHIVQIEFNAWHYIEGNLWASLVEHILTSMRASSASSGMDAQAELLKQLEFVDQEVQKAQAHQEKVEKALRDAEDRVNDIKAEHEEARKTLADISAMDVLQKVELPPHLTDEIKNLLQRLGIPYTKQTAADFQAALTGARALLTRGNVLLTTLESGKGLPFYKQRWFYLMLLLVGVPIAAFLIGWLVKVLLNSEAVAQISALLGGIAAALATLIDWFTKQSERVSRILSEVESANQKIDQVAAEKYAEKMGDLAAAEQRLTQLNAELIAAQQERDRLKQHAEEIREELRSLSPERALARFLQDRTESDDYRKYLGIPALIRRDFQKLSEQIQSLNEELETSNNQQPDADQIYINRVVLYIDDLDRCPPDRVVQVLQAVHLLLAFPLFVVVVGVDARWIAHSLRQHYPGLLVEPNNQEPTSTEKIVGQIGQDMNRQATPYDYLEKIFQIPLWLAQISDEGSRKMLDGLLEDSIVLNDSVTQEGDSDIPSPGTQQPLSNSVADSERTAPVAAVQQQVNGDGAQARPNTPPAFNPDTLKIREDELYAMQDLARILGRTPRAVKRFVNLYRLIRAGIEDEDELAIFLESGDYRCVLLLLAVDTGKPEIAGTLYNTIHTRTINTLRDLVSNSNSMLPPRLEIVRVWFEQMDFDKQLAWGLLSLSQFAKWISAVRRYSFNQE